MPLFNIRNVLRCILVLLVIISEFSQLGCSAEKNQSNNGIQVRSKSHNKKQINRRGQRLKSSINIYNQNDIRIFMSSNPTAGNLGGLWPTEYNVAVDAVVTTNATCGEIGPEEYCRITDAHPQKMKPTFCSWCDANASDPMNQHPISNAIFGNSPKLWWQSPTLMNGEQYEYVTITLDLGLLHEIKSVEMKSGVSPRPAAWIIEKSIDGVNYSPWQYFANNDDECRKRYNLTAHDLNAELQTDSEVICSTLFHKVIPLENGPFYLDLLNGRPGANKSSKELLDFILARYIRLRFQGMHTRHKLDNNHQWIVKNQDELNKRSFYSLKSLQVNGRLFCSGHANYVFTNEMTKKIECQCMHNTCGVHCEKCCPQFNQQPYSTGDLMNENPCIECECNGHSTECYYDSEIDKLGLSIDKSGVNRGGGVCLNCTDFTAGVNCETCIEGYYRPIDIGADAINPCLPCECNPDGSYPGCNAVGGQCDCRPGFAGHKCDQCQVGYTGSNCKKCLCDQRGTLPDHLCDDECECKENVGGPHCNECKKGHYSLSAGLDIGCLKCFCSGISTTCKSFVGEWESFSTIHEWTITDISGLNKAKPTVDMETGYLVFVMYEMPDIEAVYWSAPEDYTGNWLNSYGSMLEFNMSWVVVRGDTSGKATIGPNVILIGSNGMKIAYGDDVFTGSLTTLSIPVNETGWYHVPEEVRDIVTRLRRTDYRGGPVTRDQFMSVLLDVKSVLIRGTFHTDQAESILENVVLYSAVTSENSSVVTTIEECECPLGYIGLSCEICDFGYVQVFENTTDHHTISKCIPCNCNGHAETCDLATGKCGPCHHNTNGEKCEYCEVGFYGNPSIGTENDCRPCACPLYAMTNNFSPECTLRFTSTYESTIDDAISTNRSFPADFICTQCPDGYSGDYCERCSDGFYGNPMVVGSECLPCPCNGGPCDPDTGRCIVCTGNTEGWRCEKCKPGFWGSPEIGCIECACYLGGSIDNVCNRVDGKCSCKSRYSGHHCDECEIGFGDILLDCPQCDCNRNGSVSNNCNQRTGHCTCRVGVEGVKCDTCSENYYGLSVDGCADCRCHRYGAIERVCNRKTGLCKCKPNVSGRACDKCIHGHYNIESGFGCSSCNCDAIGCNDGGCNQVTGQCNCRSGIGGLQCEKCLEGYYGFSQNGCRKCDQCTSSEHICDPNTGRCICPPLTFGIDCKSCLPNSWGWTHQIGCKDCNCQIPGSIGLSCNSTTGQCICREGFTGLLCNECAPGYHGYPECKRCSCNIHGSIRSPQSGAFECDDRGQCLCKQLVTGKKCDTCRQSTFGLSENNDVGCIRCFCFGRSQECEESDLIWGQIRTPGARNLSIDYVASNQINAEDYAYAVVIVMQGKDIYEREVDIKHINGLQLVPSTHGNVSIGAHKYFQFPLYFQLSQIYQGDRILSYGGYLKYSLESKGRLETFDPTIISQFPLVRLHTHNKLIIDYYGPELFEYKENITYSIKLTEHHWYSYPAKHDISRAIMMTALQNVKHVFVRAFISPTVAEVVLSNVTMDTAIHVSGAWRTTNTVEKCNCPSAYNASSCQDPADGYYRHMTPDNHREETLEDFIGIALKCQCNGRSNTCEKDTGKCLNCREHTGGMHCEQCAEGFYGHPDTKCVPCPCPETNRNYATGCSVRRNEVYCVCKPGYTGPKCDKCEMGFFGILDSPLATCEPCDCNPNGIVSNECDELTGQCNCKLGVTGTRCDQCEEERHVLKENGCTLCDNCTLTLLDTLDFMDNDLIQHTNHISGEIRAPWPILDNIINQVKASRQRLDNYNQVSNHIMQFNDTVLHKMKNRAKNLNNKLNKLAIKCSKAHDTSNKYLNEVTAIFTDATNLKKSIHEVIDTLNAYENNPHHANLTIALKEAEFLLDDIEFKTMEHNHYNDVLNCSRNSMDFWVNQNDEISQLNNLMSELKSELNGFANRIDDLKLLTENTENNAIISEELHVTNEIQFTDLLEKYKLIEQHLKEFNGLSNNSLIPKIKDSLKQIIDKEKDISEIIEEIDFLANKVSELEQTDKPLLVNLKDGIVSKARKHANHLQKLANEYVQMFKQTKDGAAVALMASTAYKNIIEAIESAKRKAQEAQEAIHVSNDALNPDGKSIIDQALVSLKTSEGIQHNATSATQQINSLKEDLQDRKSDLLDAAKIIRISSDKNNAVEKELNAFASKESGIKVSEILQDVDAVKDDLEHVKLTINEVNEGMHDLRQRISSLGPKFDSEIGLASENVSISESNIQTTLKLLKIHEANVNQDNMKFKTMNDSVSISLQQLKDTIAKAKHIAEGIRVSVQSSCIRSYVPQVFGVTTANNIKMTIALANNTKDAILAFIPGDNGKYLILQMVNRQIRFIWNLGGGAKTIQHKMKLVERERKFDDAWYQIEAHRVMNLGSLKVQRMTTTGSLDESPIVSDTSNQDYTRFIITPDDRIWIGGIPNDVKPKELGEIPVGLGIVLHQLQVDNKQIGLWHFAHSEGTCNGAVMGAQEIGTITSARYFNGEGYANITKSRSRPIRKNFFALQITFKTMDENALLFLAVDNKNNRSISLTLHEGRIIFRIDYGVESKLEINTTKRYNIGQWVNVEAAREFTARGNTENGHLRVNNDEPISGSPTTPITSNILPDLSKGNYYIGGLPPGFRAGTPKAPGADHGLLGCVKDIQINGETYDPLESSQYFGIESSCKDFINRAGFFGNGFVEMNSHSLKKRGNLGMVFKTLQPDCVILLAAYPPNLEDFDAKDIRGNYSVSLIEGKVVVWANSGRGRIELLSNETVNDGEFHVLSLMKSGRRLELRIDDSFNDAESLPEQPYTINLPEVSGGLFIGGIPNVTEFESLVPTVERFEGTIQDLVFNNHTINLFDAIALEKVHLGRPGPQMGMSLGSYSNMLMKTEPIAKSFTPTPEGCQKIGVYSYEPNAFKFGDRDHSYSSIPIQPRHLWHKNFNIQLSFRTFYPSGLLFIAPGTKEKQKHFIALILRDGYLNLIIRSRRKETVSLPVRFNDGEWHHVTIVNTKSRIILKTNGHKSTNTTKIPKKIFTTNTLYIGGIPETGVQLPPDLQSKVESFKGCLRRFSINNATQDLAKPARHQFVGQCFPSIERGSYFPGDGYAVYKKNFNVGSVLEFDIEFRTSELNGVLLSIADPIGFPAMSLELNGGKLIFSADLGDGNPFHAESEFSSKYALCNNKWHTISAVYDSDQLALKIDEQPLVIALAQHLASGKVNTRHSLYIGGLPDNAPSGTLGTRENFKGCIRNVNIRGERKDWTDMDNLFNVHLSECLLIN